MYHQETVIKIKEKKKVKREKNPGQGPACLMVAHPSIPWFHQPECRVLNALQPCSGMTGASLI